ncbi:MAG: PrsW family glutamic-type intramembrane protease [Thermoanaerobaculia bacterium]
MVNAAVALVPVVVFLAVLVLMDSFKLVPLRAVVRLIVAGGVAAFSGARLHGWILDGGLVSATALSRYVAPVTEELLKALPVAWLLARRRIGFLVDAAILGFAVGAGFALVENVEYLRALGQGSVFLWIVRGFGTAVLHGGTTSILAVLAKGVEERHPGAGLAAILPGFAVAVAIHSLFNHFILPPVLATLVLFVTLPVLLVAVFSRSEKGTREWLGAGFDSDVEMLQSTLGQDVAETRVGRYLLSLRSRFEGPVVADMMCLLRVHLELSIRAKGVLMAREAGIPIEVGEDVRANLNELRYLERSIGPTGRLALQPMLQTSSRHLWQIYMLETEGEAGAKPAPGT